MDNNGEELSESRDEVLADVGQMIRNYRKHVLKLGAAEYSKNILNASFPTYSSLESGYPGVSVGTFFAALQSMNALSAVHEAIKSAVEPQIEASMSQESPKSARKKTSIDRDDRYAR